jgi:hypothetical protein
MCLKKDVAVLIHCQNVEWELCRKEADTVLDRASVRPKGYNRSNDGSSICNGIEVFKMPPIFSDAAIYGWVVLKQG